MAASPAGGNGGQLPPAQHFQLQHQQLHHHHRLVPPPPLPVIHQHRPPPATPRSRPPPPPPPVMSHRLPPTVAPLPPLNRHTASTTPTVTSLLGGGIISTGTTSSTTVPAASSPTTTATGSVTVTLAVPRPENERASNEYVETPFRSGRGSPLSAATAAPHHHLQHSSHHPTPLPLATATTTTTTATALPPAPLSPLPAVRPHRLPLSPQGSTVTKQPTTGTVAASFSKVPPFQGAGECAARPSIVCPECGRCRCESCQVPRPLPQRWCCRDSCLVSADSIIDYASCLCCVKGLFYHCGDSSAAAESGGASCADDPCGCSGDRRAARWGCMATLACALPCLWLYWPLQGCKRVVEECYARHSRTGCRCRPSQQQQQHQQASVATVAHTPQKRLLDSSPDF